LYYLNNEYVVFLNIKEITRSSGGDQKSACSLAKGTFNHLATQQWAYKGFTNSNLYYIDIRPTVVHVIPDILLCWFTSNNYTCNTWQLIRLIKHHSICAKYSPI